MNSGDLSEIALLEQPDQTLFLTERVLQKKKKIYYGLIGLGYASLVAQLISAKFVFTNCNTAFASIFKHIFDTEVEESYYSWLSFLLTFLDSTKDVTSIFPEKDARIFLGLEMNDGKLVLKEDRESKQNFMMAKKSDWDSLKEIALISVPVLAMSVNFINTAMPSWISMNTWIGDDPKIDIPIGVTLLICHTSYFFLLAASDVLKGFKEIRNIKKSPFGVLFEFSKLIFSAPLIKIIIAATYRATRSAYTFDEFATKVMDIKNIPTRNIFKAIAATSSSIVLILSRSLRSFEHYLEPIRVGENEYKIDLLREQQRSPVDQSLNYDNKRKKLFHLPVAIVRSLTIFFIVYGIFYNMLKGKDVSEGGSIAFSSLCSLLVSGLVFTQVHLSETRHEKNIIARKAFDHMQIVDIEFEQKSAVFERSNIQSLAKFISLGCNFGNQATEALLTVVAMITLLGSVLGNRNAAALGLMVGIESGWVNFHYFKDKIQARVSQILDGGTQISLSLINRFHGVFRARNYERLEEVKLEDVSDDHSRNKTVLLTAFNS